MPQADKLDDLWLQGVLGCIVVNKDGVILKTTCEVLVHS